MLELGNRVMRTMRVEQLIEASGSIRRAAMIDIEMYDQHGDPLGTGGYLRLDFEMSEPEGPRVIITSAIDEDRGVPDR